MYNSNIKILINISDLFHIAFLGNANWIDSVPDLKCRIGNGAGLQMNCLI